MEKKEKISTKLKKALNRNSIRETEDLAKEDLIRKNKDNIIEDISQRKGLSVCSGLSVAERDYILSDSMISSAIQLYVADILAICNRSSYRLVSVDATDETDSNIAEKEAKATFILNQIFSDSLIETIGINLLTNGEVFLDTKYNKGLNNFSVSETFYSYCTQLLFSDDTVAGYIANIMSSDATAVNAYSYSFGNTQEAKLIDACNMVRVYNPTYVNSKVYLDISEEDDDFKDLLSFTADKLFYKNSQSLLKQVYPDWLNSKLLELAVYRDRIAKSRFIQLIALELGRTSRITSDQIYDNVKEYFDKRSVIDLDKQTYKSVVGNEPFTDYKVYTTRNGVGALKFDNSLNGADANVSSLADLEYNQTKVFAGLGIPKQYLGADDNGSALSNGGSLFFISEKYQKRVVAYVKRIAQGLKDCVKNLLIQQMGKEYIFNWDFTIEFDIPENNEDVYRVKSARIDYANQILDLAEKLESLNKDSSDIKYSIDAFSDLIQEDLKKIISVDNTKEEEK